MHTVTINIIKNLQRFSCMLQQVRFACGVRVDIFHDGINAIIMVKPISLPYKRS